MAGTREEALALALAAADAFHDELAATLFERLAGPFANGADPGVLLHLASVTLEDFVPGLARLMAESELAAWLAGTGEVIKALPAGALAGGPALPGYAWHWDGSQVWLPVVEEAVEELKGRQVVTRPEWDALGEDVRRRSFAASYAKTVEEVAVVRDAIAEAVAEGSGFPAFRERVESSTGPLGVGLLQSSFRTGTMLGYSAGMDRVLAGPVANEVFPFEATEDINDSRETELCYTFTRHGIQGTNVFLRSDPVYQRYRAPRHWQCRCKRRPMTVAGAAARGIRYAQEWLRLGAPPPEPPLVPEAPIPLPEGWLTR